MANFRVGDALVTLSYKNDFLSKAIQFYQREILRHPDPAWRSTHVEVVLAVTETGIVTGSQTFPKAKHQDYRKSYIRFHLTGDRPKYALFRFKNYSEIVTPIFAEAMIEWWRDKIGSSRGTIESLWGGFYDVGQLLMYPINWIAKKFGYTKHLAWLEKTKANVCSDAVASSWRAGLTADSEPEDYVFEGISSAEVAPSHFWVEPNLMRRL